MKAVLLIAAFTAFSRHQEAESIYTDEE